MDARGFTFIGKSGDWTACRSDCCGYGRTRKEAIADALKDARSQLDDSDRLDRESGTVRDRYRFPIID